MNDLAAIAARLSSADVRPAPPAARPVPTVQESGRARFHAEAEGPKDTPEQTLALVRLDRALAAEQPPRTDVPRGYYLDIVV